MDKGILVTGGSGFIGTWVLRELLQRGVRPVVVDQQSAPERWQRVLGNDRARVTQANVSLVDRDGLQSVIDQNGVTHVIHLAALLTPACQQDPFVGCQVNVLGSTAVFDAARCSGRVRAISYASSFAVYGDEACAVVDAGAGPGLERPPMFYGAFKLAVDLIAEQYWRHCKIASVAVRPHVVYGPERTLGLTAGPSLACRAAALGERYVIGYTGRAGYDYVEDVAKALVRSAFDCPDGATVVDLPGEVASTEEVLTAITAAAPDSAGRIVASGPSLPSNVPARRRDIRRLFHDWRATSLLDGIGRTVDYYRSRPKEPDVASDRPV